ncbi:hypothetical protein, partial [Vibrio cholerae]|uniref:hypothetical protein n=1 Tax=Vibrio cholerae TaxID=666 RepID=UPI001BAE9D73
RIERFRKGKKMLSQALLPFSQSLLSFSQAIWALSQAKTPLSQPFFKDKSLRAIREHITPTN